MEKKHIVIFIIVIILSVFVGGTAITIFNGANTGDNNGVEQYQQRERELLNRIGEYEQREQARVEAERIRITAENIRIERARERIERTEIAIRAIWEFDRRTGELLQELIEEIKILADNGGCLSGKYSNDDSYIGSE